MPCVEEIYRIHPWGVELRFNFKLESVEASLGTLYSRLVIDNFQRRCIVIILIKVG